MGTLIDGKYGEITIPRDTQPGEPAFVLRGKDALAPIVMQLYADLLSVAAAGGDHLDIMRIDVLEAAEEMRAWQAIHGARLPD